MQKPEFPTQSLAPELMFHFIMNLMGYLLTTLAGRVPKFVIAAGAILSLLSAAPAQATFLDRCRVALGGASLSARDSKTQKYVNLLKAEAGPSVTPKEFRNPEDTVRDLVTAIFADVYDLEDVSSMARKGIQWLAQHDLSKNEKAEIWRQMAEQMETRTLRSFFSDEFVGSDGSALFQNTYTGLTLVIAPDGSVYRGTLDATMDPNVFPRPIWRADYRNLKKVGEPSVTPATSASTAAY